MKKLKILMLISLNCPSNLTATYSLERVDYSCCQDAYEKFQKIEEYEPNIDIFKKIPVNLSQEEFFSCKELCRVMIANDCDLHNDILDCLLVQVDLLKYVQILSIANNNISNIGFLSLMMNLKEVNISGNCIEVLPVLYMENLETFLCHHNQTPLDICTLKGSRLPNILTLIIKRTPKIETLYLPLINSLEYVDFSCNGSSNIEIDNCFLGKLKEFNLLGNDLTNETICSLNNVAFSYLRILDLSDNDQINELPSSINMPLLADISFSHFGSDSSVIDESSIKNFNGKNIDSLCFINCMKNISLSISIQQTLKTLYLADNNLTDKNIRILSKKPLYSLEKFFLSNNRIKKFTSFVKKNKSILSNQKFKSSYPKLLILDLENNQIKDYPRKKQIKDTFINLFHMNISSNPIEENPKQMRNLFLEMGRRLDEIMVNYFNIRNLDLPTTDINMKTLIENFQEISNNENSENSFFSSSKLNGKKREYINLELSQDYEKYVRCIEDKIILSPSQIKSLYFKREKTTIFIVKKPLSKN
jgi:hypothetical protein